MNFPLPVYNYKVEIAGETIAFSEVSGLSIEYEPIEFKQSPIASGPVGPEVIHMPGPPTPANVTLKKGVVKGNSIKVFYEWINNIHITRTKKDIFVRLCDETGEAVISWKVTNAFPTKLEAPGFDASSKEIAVESMELIGDAVTMEEA